MKRPVTSLCRRPGKKTACGAVCPRCGNNFRHRDALRRAGRSAGQKPPGRGLKNSPGRGAGRLTPHGGMAGNGRYLVAESDLIGCPPGQRACLGTKNSPRRRPGTAPTGEWQTIGGVWCREASHWAARRSRGYARAQNSPGEGRGLCADCAHRELQAWGCLVPESITLGARRGRGHARVQKQPPAEAGGCLDAGYGCYLPRAIRVIWMHRVGSTARPRIMPS